MQYTALIVAAGSGSRLGLGYNKMLYRFQDGDTILKKTTQIFIQDERCKQIIVVSSEEDIHTYKILCNHKKIKLVIGGATRQDSVYQGLKVVKESYVLIHDGARPWLSMECIDRILTTLSKHAACLLCVPVKDTIKVVKNGCVVETLPREDLRQAQTPQAFETKLVKDAYEKAMCENIIATDDAQIVELCTGVSVQEVLGSYENIKVTTKEDLINK